MKTKISNLLIICLLLLIIIFFLSFPDAIIDQVSFSIVIWKDNLIPSLFPFFLVANLLINYGFVELVEEFLQKIMVKFFHLPGASSFVLIGSLVSGFPSSSNYIHELLDNKKIDTASANYLLKFNHFANPLFVIGTVGTLLLNNKKLGIMILLVHILANFVIAIIYRPKNKYMSQDISVKRGIINMQKKASNIQSFSEVLTNSIFKTFKTLLLLLGIITTFLIISTIIDQIFNLNPLSSTIISGILEMTQGIKKVASLNLSLKIKASIISFFLSFGGLSIHMQVMSILSDYKINYLSYFIARTLHGIIASSSIYLLLSFIN